MVRSVFQFLKKSCSNFDKDCVDSTVDKAHEEMFKFTGNKRKAN